MLDVMMVLEL